MPNINTQLSSLNNKLQFFINAYRELKKENVQLKIELEEVAEAYHRQKKDLLSLQQEYDFLKIASNNNITHEEKEKLCVQIEMHLKDIEKCLALLNAQ